MTLRTSCLYYRVCTHAHSGVVAVADLMHQIENEYNMCGISREEKVFEAFVDCHFVGAVLGRL